MNQYHYLCFKPKLSAQQLGQKLEELAVGLVESGLLRIAQDVRRNFVLFKIPQQGISRSFSKRQLSDPALRSQALDYISLKLEKYNMRDNTHTVRAQASEWLSRLNKELNQLVDVPADYELQLARMLVQACHAAVIQLILNEKVEIYISLGDSVSELLDVRDWAESRFSNGLQKTSSQHTAVFISCGGDPFLSPSATAYVQGRDGFEALSRFMVIAAQELGHFSEITRDTEGDYSGRFSIGLNGFATAEIRKARLDDITHLNELADVVKNKEVMNLYEIERNIEFNTKHNKPLMGLKIQRYFAEAALVKSARKHKISYILGFPAIVYNSSNLAHNLVVSLEDMAFNLHPIADAYQDPNAEKEETILCMEALARVPQQVIKWGNRATQAAYPNLYKLYYGQVIKACIAATL